MTHKKLLEEFNETLFQSGFQEAKRQFEYTFKTKVDNEVSLSLLLNIPEGSHIIGEKIISKNIAVFITKWSENEKQIMYKIGKNFYKKTVLKKNNVFKYIEYIKMYKSPWGIERQFLKRTLKREAKNNFKRILNILNNFSG